MDYLKLFYGISIYTQYQVIFIYIKMIVKGFMATIYLCVVSGFCFYKSTVACIIMWG